MQYFWKPYLEFCFLSTVEFLDGTLHEREETWYTTGAEVYKYLPTHCQVNIERCTCGRELWPTFCSAGSTKLRSYTDDSGRVCLLVFAFQALGNLNIIQSRCQSEIDERVISLNQPAHKVSWLTVLLRIAWVLHSGVRATACPRVITVGCGDCDLKAKFTYTTHAGTRLLEWEWYKTV